MGDEAPDPCHAPIVGRRVMQFEVFTNLLPYGCDSPSVHMVIVTDSKEPTPPEQLDHAPIKSQWGYTMYNILSSMCPARTIRTPEDTPIQILVCSCTTQSVDREATLRRAFSRECNKYGSSACCARTFLHSRSGNDYIPVWLYGDYDHSFPH